MNTSKLLSAVLAFALVAMLGGCAGSPTNPLAATTAATTLAGAPAGSFEEGTSPADEIVKTTAAEKVILVVSFGTSYNQSRALTIGGIEAAIKTAYPDYQVRRAFTSQIIIDKLAERDKLVIDNIEEAMSRLLLDKVKEVIIQPTHVMSGFEYNDMMEAVLPFAGRFDSFQIGKPLLSSDADYNTVAEQIVAATESFRAGDTAIVFMGHGTEHAAGAAYVNLQNVLTDKGYIDYIIGTVEHGVEIDAIQEMLSEMGVSKVVLRPLMVVAGDHANNDMAGDEEDSWKVILEGSGYEVTTVLEGLGQLPGIQDVYIQHIRDAMDSENLSADAPAAFAAGLSPVRLKNGVYDIEVSSSTSMFKIVACQLTVEDSRMSAVVTLSGQGFGALYLGTGEAALLEPTDDNFYPYTDDGERHSFTVPVEALDKELECSGLSIRKQEWYDHIVVFKADMLPADAFLPCEIDATLVGGTGKASIQSPAKLTYADGQDWAEVVWSSPNYTYMLVDGVEYLPVNTEGNSTFVIPVALGVDMPVTACTVAMSEPREIEYTLHFDAESIK